MRVIFQEDLSKHYRVKRLCLSLKTKAPAYAICVSKFISQRLKDYLDWISESFPDL